MSNTDDLVAEFFGGEVEEVALDPEQKRAAILARIDEIIDILKPLDVEWQRLMQARFGTLGWGGMVIKGANDRDGCERWRYVRNLWETADEEELAAVELRNE